MKSKFLFLFLSLFMVVGGVKAENVTIDNSMFSITNRNYKDYKKTQDGVTFTFNAKCYNGYVGDTKYFFIDKNTSKSLSWSFNGQNGKILVVTSVKFNVKCEKKSQSVKATTDLRQEYIISSSNSFADYTIDNLLLSSQNHVELKNESGEVNIKSITITYEFWDAANVTGSKYLFFNGSDNQKALGNGADAFAALANDKGELVTLQSNNTTNLTTIKLGNNFLYDAMAYQLKLGSSQQNNVFYFVPQGNNSYKIFIPNDLRYAFGQDGNGNICLVESANAKTFFLADTKVYMSVSGAAGYGTLVSPFAITLPDAVTAYNVTDKGSYVKLAESGTQSLSANTPVILKNNTGANVTQYYYGNTPSNNPKTVESVCLVGVYEKTFVDAGNYLLQYKNENCAFYPVAQSNTLSVAPNRAYLKGSGSAVKALSFGDVDAIDEVVSSKNGTMYDLIGRELTSKPNKGMYIVNGKKVMVK